MNNYLKDYMMRFIMKNIIATLISLFILSALPSHAAEKEDYTLNENHCYVDERCATVSISKITSPPASVHTSPVATPTSSLSSARP